MYAGGSAITERWCDVLRHVLSRRVSVEADPQAAVTPGRRPGTATVTAPDGRQVHVVGDYREVQIRLQDAAARAHEGGDATHPNRPAG